jgi:hypothetical protein
MPLYNSSGSDVDDRGESVTPAVIIATSDWSSELGLVQ